MGYRWRVFESPQEWASIQTLVGIYLLFPLQNVLFCGVESYLDNFGRPGGWTCIRALESKDTGLLLGKGVNPTYQNKSCSLGLALFRGLQDLTPVKKLIVPEGKGIKFFGFFLGPLFYSLPGIFSCFFLPRPPMGQRAPEFVKKRVAISRRASHLQG